MVLFNRTSEQNNIVESVDKYNLIGINAFVGTGKAQPFYEKIYTPKGHITFDDVKVGDKI